MKTHIPRIPKGCDQQGRHPEAASAASEMDDIDYRPIGGGWVDIAWSLALAVTIFGFIGVAAGWIV